MDNPPVTVTSIKADLPGPAPIDPACSALFLDVDGTLVDIAPTPDAVRVPDGLPVVLDRLHRLCGGALALVSGRAIADLDRLFAPLRLPAAGIHGAEVRFADAVEDRAVDFPDPVALRAELGRLAGAHPGVEIEDKGPAIAIHYRAAPAAQAAVQAAAEALARRWGLHLQAGKCVVEIKASPRTKGDALREMMARAPFAGRRPVMIGDDVTDEDGFHAALALDGTAIRVGDSGGRRTAATALLPDPASLCGWLAALAAAKDGEARA